MDEDARLAHFLTKIMKVFVRSVEKLEKKLKTKTISLEYSLMKIQISRLRQTFWVNQMLYEFADVDKRVFLISVKNAGVKKN